MLVRGFGAVLSMFFFEHAFLPPLFRQQAFVGAHIITLHCIGRGRVTR